jgi:hypothetical protein
MALWTYGHVELASKEFLAELRVLPHINHGTDRRLKRRATLWALDGEDLSFRHDESDVLSI